MVHLRGRGGAPPRPPLLAEEAAGVAGGVDHLRLLHLRPRVPLVLAEAAVLQAK